MKKDSNYKRCHEKMYNKGIGPILQERLQKVHAATVIRRSLRQRSVARGTLPLQSDRGGDPALWQTTDLPGPRGCQTGSGDLGGGDYLCGAMGTNHQKRPPSPLTPQGRVNQKVSLNLVDEGGGGGKKIASHHSVGEGEGWPGS